MARTVSFAHTEHTNLLMLDLEALVLKGAAIDGASELGGLGWGDPSHLEEHALDDAMKIGLNIAQKLTI